jgi:hypothetical protein
MWDFFSYFIYLISSNQTQKIHIAAKFVMKGLCHGTTQTKLQYVHVDLGCQKGVHLALIGGMPNWHSKDCSHDGAHHLAEGVLKEKSNLANFGKVALTQYFGRLSLPQISEKVD